jgi:multiple sugar transport system permease protein
LADVAVAPGGTPAPTPAPRPRRRRRLRRLSRTDKVVLAVLLGIPTLLHIVLVWVPTLASVVLSFSVWNGVGDLSTIKWVGFQNYRQIFTIYPPFRPALWHNALWIVFLLALPTLFGLFLAAALDKPLRGTRVYQSILYIPVVLAPALVGFITQIVFSRDTGLLNGLLGLSGDSAPDWLGSSHLNLPVAMLMSGWRHAGYVMVLYLAGLKSVDYALREAASLDGASEWQTFRHVIFPALRPINVIVLVVTVMEALRAFDLVYVINKGTNGLELLSVLVTQNIIGEAGRIGYGSAIAVVLLVVSMVFIVIYLTQVFRKDAEA